MPSTMPSTEDFIEEIRQGAELMKIRVTDTPIMICEDMEVYMFRAYIKPIGMIGKCIVFILLDGLLAAHIGDKLIVYHR